MSRCKWKIPKSYKKNYEKSGDSAKKGSIDTCIVDYRIRHPGLWNLET